MPNHVTNEIVFRDLLPEQRRSILAGVINKDGDVDFEILVPIPLNVWQGSVGVRHERKFRGLISLDWCRENWGTKWNAYECRRIEFEEPLRIVFDTAWRPPYGWLIAVFNRFALPFEHNWLDEGESCAHCDRWDPSKLDDLGGDPWTEEIASDAEYRRLRKLKWGVETFEDEGL